MYMFIYIYICICIHITNTYTYIYIYIYTHTHIISLKRLGVHEAPPEGLPAAQAGVGPAAGVCNYTL